VDIKEAWQKAYDLHYKSRNPDDKKQALSLYHRISREYPYSEQGQYSQTQIENLQKSNPELFNAESTIKDYLIHNDVEGVTPITVDSDALLTSNSAQIPPPLPLPPLPTYPTVTRPLAFLLTRYIDREIGINHKEPKEFSSAVLSQVTDDFISVYLPEKQITISYPLQYVLNVVEAERGISTGFFFGKQYVVLIEVFHLIVYNGAVGVGVSLPI